MDDQTIYKIRITPEKKTFGKHCWFPKMAHGHTKACKGSALISSKNKASTNLTNSLPPQQQIVGPLLSNSCYESSADADEIAETHKKR